MRKSKSLWITGMLAFAMSAAWAQDTATAAAGTQDSAQQTPAAPSQDNPPPVVTDNPPLSGIDLPSLEPHAAPISYIQPGATVSESADSNVGGVVGGTSVRSVSRALGSVTMQRLWSHYDLGLDYIGGVAYYNLQGLGWKTLQQADVDQKINWKRGQLSLRDSFSYLPEGNFGNAYGSLGSQGIESLGTTSFGSFWGGTSLGTLGLAPRILNVSMADMTETLTSKSMLTAAGGYAFTHFYGTDYQTGGTFLSSSQVSLQFGYNRLLSPETQIALAYGYQGFDFSVSGTAFHTHVIQAMYGRRITGRMDFLVGVGPQFTHVNTVGVFGDTTELRLGVAGRARLRYKFPRTSLDLEYQRYLTSGSGFFAGAQTDMARLSVDRPLTRVWSAFADLGFSRNSRQQALSAQALLTCNFDGTQPALPPCPGVDANTFTTGFAGIGLHRAFGRNFHGFISYQYNELSFDHSYCGGLEVCGRISNRHVGTIGLDWTPRPIRID